MVENPLSISNVCCTPPPIYLGKGHVLTHYQDFLIIEPVFGILGFFSLYFGARSINDFLRLFGACFPTLMSCFAVRFELPSSSTFSWVPSSSEEQPM